MRYLLLSNGLPDGALNRNALFVIRTVMIVNYRITADSIRIKPSNLTEWRRCRVVFLRDLGRRKTGTMGTRFTLLNHKPDVYGTINVDTPLTMLSVIARLLNVNVQLVPTNVSDLYNPYRPNGAWEGPINDFLTRTGRKGWNDWRGHIIFKNDSERGRRSNSPFFHTDDEFLIQRNFTGLRLVPTIKQVDNIIKFYYRAVISCFLFPFSPPRRHSHSLQCVKNILPFLAISFSPYYSIWSILYANSKANIITNRGNCVLVSLVPRTVNNNVIILKISLYYTVTIVYCPRLLSSLGCASARKLRLGRKRCTFWPCYTYK
jgi:hypothetical protein